MISSRRLLYPDPYTGGLPDVELSSTLEKVHEFGTAIPAAHRIPLIFSKPASVIIKIDSVIGAEKDWLRAGSLAQVLTALEQPKKKVSRLYLDEAFLELDGSGYSYFLEFWPNKWLADYYLEVWARLTPARLILQLQGTPLTIGGEPFTIDGVILIL